MSHRDRRGLRSGDGVRNIVLTGAFLEGIRRDDNLHGASSDEELMTLKAKGVGIKGICKRAFVRPAALYGHVTSQYRYPECHELLAV